MTNKTDTSELEQFIKAVENLLARPEEKDNFIAPSILLLAKTVHSELQTIKERLDRLEDYQQSLQTGAAKLLEKHTVLPRLDVNPKSHTYLDESQKTLGDR